MKSGEDRPPPAQTRWRCSFGAVVAAALLFTETSGCASGTQATTDANPAAPDANPAAPDANPAAPDANPAAPDANPAAPDANPSAPDAHPADAAVPPPDAGDIAGLPYPVRDPYHIKGIQPDDWDIDQLSANYVGIVSLNLLWGSWQPTRTTPPCAGGQEEYEGYCFSLASDNSVRDWTDKGVTVTAILYGVPEWARTGNTGCSPIGDGFDIFCTPDNPADFGRFAGMIARRYDGTRGHGRIANFVIHNEVNTNARFDIGCGQGTSCNLNSWIDAYVANYTAAYDQIKKHQTEAKVLVSMDHSFDTSFDLPSAAAPTISVKTFLQQFNARVGNRDWVLAYHPNPTDLLSPTFSHTDLPYVTYGNVGHLVAWMRQTFPSRQHAWNVQLTEGGINSAAPSSSEGAQATALCNSFRIVLGTPGITDFIYYRMKDDPTAGNLHAGLASSSSVLRQAWTTWANANRIDESPPQLSCGFEHLPYTRLSRYFNSAALGAHWATTRVAPSGFTLEESWFLLRESAAGTKLIYECMVNSPTVGPTTFMSDDVGCDGNLNLGPVGYIWTAAAGDRVPLHSCRIDAATDYFISDEANCEGQTSLGLIGYAIPAT